MSSGTSPGGRYFFALWPDDAVREQLYRLGRHVVHKNGHRIRMAQLHITLTFLGPMSDACLECVHENAARIQGQGFDLALERVGVWRKQRIQWLAPGRTPAALHRLVTQLRGAMEGCGFLPERRAFRPHVTLARKVNTLLPVVSVAPVHWSVREFALIRSVTHQEGPAYELLKRWPLLGKGAEQKATGRTA